MPLTAKLAAAALKVGGKLKADKTNREQGYDYVSADAILSECGQALAEQGIVIFPEIVDSAVDVFLTANNKTRYDARVNFIFEVADEAEARKYTWIGLGSDYTVPDKAHYKAITSGHRYFLAKLLNVGEDNEDGEHEKGDEEATGKGTTKRLLGKVPNCPKCGGPRWDNRGTPEKPKLNPRAPDYKCKNKACNGARWETPLDGDNSGNNGSEPRAAAGKDEGKDEGKGKDEAPFDLNPETQKAVAAAQQSAKPANGNGSGDKGDKTIRRKAGIKATGFNVKMMDLTTRMIAEGVTPYWVGKEPGTIDYDHIQYSAGTQVENITDANVDRCLVWLEKRARAKWAEELAQQAPVTA